MKKGCNPQDLTTGAQPLMNGWATSKTKLITRTSNVQQWHSNLSAGGQADLGRILADWGLPIRDIAKPKAPSLLKTLSLGTLMLARPDYSKLCMIEQNPFRAV